jgi:hypothetical protein
MPGRVSELAHVCASHNVEGPPQRLARDRDEDTTACDAHQLGERAVRVRHVLEHPIARAPELRAELGRTAREDVAPYTPEAWAEGMQRALAAVGRSRA